MAGADYDGVGIAEGKPISDHRRRLRKWFLLLPKKGNHPQQVPEPDRDRLLIAPPTDLASKKKGFAAAAFRGLGCTTLSAQVYAPSTTASVAAAAVRSSADWQGKKSRSRRKKSMVKNNETERERERERERRNQTAADMWCAPGIGFSSGDASIDCVAPSFQLHRSQSRGRVAAAAVDSERIQREDLYVERRGGTEEHLSSLFESTLSPLEAPLFGSDLIFPRHIHRARRIHRSHGGVDEIMMFQTRMMLGEMDMHDDRYKDWRLDVDNMTYEELLELGDRIGYVNTGLREEDIVCCVRKMAQSPIQCSTELERKCSICQEDYEVKDEVGKLDCGHSYHIYCIKQWLLRKNACPVCKATVAKT